MATIFDIAKEAGVSITTVSRALNGYSDVSEKTRQKIVAVAERLNYYPNAAARSLQGKRTNIIAFAPRLYDDREIDLFLKDFAFLRDFIGTLSLASLKHDLSLLVTLPEKPKDLREVYRELAGTGRVDGVILADIEPHDERIELLNELDLPFVAFGRTMDAASLSYPFLDVDGLTGMSTMVNYLHQQGHERIAYLSGEFRATCMYYRYDGYQQAMAKAGLSADPALFIRDVQEEAGTKDAVEMLFSLPMAERPTAIITSHDRLALSALYSLNEAGLTVGRDRKQGQVALTGFDDLPFAAFLKPSLTTLRQPVEAACTILVDMMASILKNEDEFKLDHHATVSQLGTKQFLVQPELIARDSA